MFQTLQWINSMNAIHNVLHSGLAGPSVKS